MRGNDTQAILTSMPGPVASAWSRSLLQSSGRCLNPCQPNAEKAVAVASDAVVTAMKATSRRSLPVRRDCQVAHSRPTVKVIRMIVIVSKAGSFKCRDGPSPNDLGKAVLT